MKTDVTARFLCLVGFLALAACKSAATGLDPVSTGGMSRPLVAVATLESARVDASLVHRSCVGARGGERYCREDLVEATDQTTLDELTEDCARRGGTTSSTRCVRDGAVASCSVNGTGIGAITVYAYAQTPQRQRAIATVEEQCDEFEGTFSSL